MTDRVARRAARLLILDPDGSVFLQLHDDVEIGLHCHYRTLASNEAMMALPECFLGVLPGWGGTQLLPKIAGPENAVTVII